MNSPRALLGLAWVPDGRLFALGGFDVDRQPNRTVEMLECSWTSEAACRTKWSYVAPMLEARVGHGVCYFAGKLFAAGGNSLTQLSASRCHAREIQTANGPRFDRSTGNKLSTGYFLSMAVFFVSVSLLHQINSY